MSSSPPSPSEAPAELQIVGPTTDSLSPPPPPPPSDQGGDSDRLDSAAASGDGEKNGGEGEAGEGGEEEEEEEVAECGFCLFMKGGGCKDPFIAWEKCVEEADKTGENVVEKCFEVTSLLKKCMDAHADYYAPILEAEAEAEQAVAKSSATAAHAPDP